MGDLKKAFAGDVSEYQMISLKLDMREEENFKPLLEAFFECINDPDNQYNTASALFSGVSHTQIDNWLSGESVPTFGFRMFVQRQILDHFFGEGTGLLLLPDPSTRQRMLSSGSMGSDGKPKPH